MFEFFMKLIKLIIVLLTKLHKMNIMKKYFLKGDLSSAGRASALQAEGHRFEPYRSHFYVLYGEVAQLARACGSYPQCRRFKSVLRYLECVAVLQHIFYCINLCIPDDTTMFQHNSR